MARDTYIDTLLDQRHDQCQLRVRNNMRNDLPAIFADQLCHLARHNHFGEQFIGYATDSNHTRLYLIKNKSGDKHALVLQKDFKTVANMVGSETELLKEFNKTATSYGLTIRWGGKLFHLDSSNATEIGHAIADIVLMKVSGQRCRL